MSDISQPERDAQARPQERSNLEQFPECLRGEWSAQRFTLYLNGREMACFPEWLIPAAISKVLNEAQRK